MGYTEKDCPENVKVRGLRPYDTYELTWFNPRTGEGLEDNVEIEVTHMGNIPLPKRPDDLDWAFKLKKLNTDFPIRSEDPPGPEFGSREIKYSYIETDSKA